MTGTLSTSRLALVGLGILLGYVLASAWHAADQAPFATPALAQQADSKKAVDTASLSAELEALQKRLPDQAHAMADVGDHFANLWFAAQSENWPLADFYWKETRSHLRWAVGIIPVRKDNQGREVKLLNILEAFENAPLSQLQKSIETRDSMKFVAAYRFALESCYGCHKAADKPFLRPRIPEAPSARIINFDPKAEWPK